MFPRKSLFWGGKALCLGAIPAYQGFGSRRVVGLMEQGCTPKLQPGPVCTKDKMVVEYFYFFHINDKMEFEYFYPSLLFSPPALSNALLLLSQAARGLCDPDCPRPCCPQDMALQLGLNPCASQNPSNTFL